MKKLLLSLLFAATCFGQHDAVTVLEDGLGHGTINTPGVAGAVLPYYYMGPYTYDWTGSTFINYPGTVVTNYSQTIVQANTFIAGTPVTVNAAGTWVAAYATGTLAAANAIGIVSAAGLSASQFTVVTQGVCNIGGSSLTNGAIYYVPLVQGAAVTSTAPSTAGQYVYPLATATTTSILYVSTSTPSVVYALGVGASSVTFGSGGAGSTNYAVYVSGGSASNGGASVQFLRNGTVTGGVGTVSGLFGGASSDTAVSAATGNNIDFYYGGTPTLVGQFTSTGLQEASVNNVVNVMAYGAVGDGSTNDQTAVQNAINALGGTGTVFFPSGHNFYVGAGAFGIKVFGSVTLQGAGLTLNHSNALGNSSVISYKGSGYAVGFDPDGSAYTTAGGMRDIAVSGATETGATGIQI